MAEGDGLKMIILAMLPHNFNTEEYRSGHNGPDSKSGVRKRTVGSNPTSSATICLKSLILSGFSAFQKLKLYRVFDKVRCSFCI